VQNASPPTYHRSIQSQLEANFAPVSESDATSNQETDRLSSDVIREVSEPSSPRGELSLHSWKSPGTSALTDMFRRTTQMEASPGAEENRNWDIGDRTSHGRGRTEDSAEQALHVINSNDANILATERSYLIPKTPISESHDPILTQGEQDLEGQGTIGTKLSWSSIRKIILWPREKGCTLARLLAHPKRWDRQAIWQDAVVAPISCLPAVALGLLLNILDALSYGKAY
jgi:SulP family sulfate permease